MIREIVVKLMLCHLLSVVLILISLSACTTLPKANLQAETKLGEADAALGVLSADINAYYEYLAPLLQDIKSLSEQPGWNEMEALIAADQATPVSEGDTRLDRERNSGFPEGTAKWGDSGEELFAQYQLLADRCSISEARRIGLIGRLVSMQAWYLEITFLELAADRQSQAEAAYRTVEALSQTQSELDSYVLDPLGLYEVATSH